MASIACPHCKQKVFTWWDKYRAGKWFMLYCPHCGGRVCAQPLVLAAIYFFYVWDVVLFGFLTFLATPKYLLVMLVIWLILDYFVLFVPLTPLRPKEAGAKGGGD
jgi:hypothetical protein